jgi:hypothetical protein
LSTEALTREISTAGKSRGGDLTQKRGSLRQQDSPSDGVFPETPFGDSAFYRMLPFQQFSLLIYRTNSARDESISSIIAKDSFRKPQAFFSITQTGKRQLRTFFLTETFDGQF